MFKIKDLPIPTGCFEACGKLPQCPCVRDAFIPDKERENCVEYVIVCAVTGVVLEEGQKGKPENCPVSSDVVDIPEANSENTDINELLLTSGYIQGWNDCREYVIKNS